MKKLLLLFFILTPTFALSEDTGCTLIFDNGLKKRVLTNVIHAHWHLSNDDDGMFLGEFFDTANNKITTDASGNHFLFENVNYLRLLRVNREIVIRALPVFSTIPPVPVKFVHFHCKKFSGRYFFALECADDMQGGTQIGARDDIPLYDKCIRGTPKKPTKPDPTPSSPDTQKDAPTYDFNLTYPHPFYQYHACIIKQDDEDYTPLRDDNNNIMQTWFPDNTKCEIEIDADTSLSGTCKKINQNATYSNYMGKKYIIDSNDTEIYLVPNPINHDTYHCVVPNYRIENDGRYTPIPQPQPLTPFDEMSQFIDNNFSRSVAWTNDDGEFNTKRLISDSVAVVVLGTVGGVITSKIINKTQIDNGLNYLKCTINGQNVATFGDEFIVGIQ